MSDPDRGAPSTDAEENPPADEEYARTYAAGYEEGVRSALREVLQHTSRGHTAQELRILVESRLARLEEEVELKRKGLLGPPRRPAWNSLLRAPQPARPWNGPAPPSSAPSLRLTAGASVLVREERPARALAILRTNLAAFPRLATVSLRPPELAGVPAERRTDITVSVSGSADAPHLAPGEIGGRLREPTEASGGALVYVDALEFLATEYSLDTTLRFVHWLVAQVQETGSALLVSFDRRSLELREMSLLERAFQTVV